MNIIEIRKVLDKIDDIFFKILVIEFYTFC